MSFVFILYTSVVSIFYQFCIQNIYRISVWVAATFDAHNASAFFHIFFMYIRWYGASFAWKFELNSLEIIFFSKKKKKREKKEVLKKIKNKKSNYKITN